MPAIADGGIAYGLDRMVTLPAHRRPGLRRKPGGLFWQEK